MIDRVDKDKTIKEFDKMIELNKDLIVKNEEDDEKRLTNIDFVESI